MHPWQWKGKMEFGQEEALGLGEGKRKVRLRGRKNAWDRKRSITVHVITCSIKFHWEKKGENDAYEWLNGEIFASVLSDHLSRQWIKKSTSLFMYLVNQLINCVFQLVKHIFSNTHYSRKEPATKIKNYVFFFDKHIMRLYKILGVTKLDQNNSMKKYFLSVRQIMYVIYSSTSS